MERRRRIEAYGRCEDEHGQILLIPDRWALPGDTVEHGEHPRMTVLRSFAQVGVGVEVADLREVITEVEREPDGEIITHRDRLVFDVRILGGSPHSAVWVAPDQLAELSLAPFTARALGRTPPRSDEVTIDPLALGPPPLASNGVPLARPSRHQRFAAYGLVTDPAGMVLLTRIADGYPGAGRWHLPGGGTDFGETAADGFLRELIEETNQHGRITGLLAVSHRHQRDAVGPERVAIDWHGVRVVFRAQVDRPTSARVVESAGSTQAASWFDQAEALTLDLTEVAHDAVAGHHGK